MATVIPNYNWTDWLKVQKLGRLVELKSGEVLFNGEYYFTFINASLESSGYVLVKAEYLGLRSNTVGGLTIEEILNPEPEEAEVATV